MNIVEIKNLYFGYEATKPILKNVNMTIQKGSLTTILGCNGAGKSTLFLNLNGVLKKDSGEIIINNQTLEYSKNSLLNMRKNVGIVFQDPDDQLFSADVYRDISFGPLNLGFSQEETKVRVESAMKRTGVAHLRERPTHALSYGQKKRVAIAGVLAMEPQVIILDEPTAGLDPQGVEEIMTLLSDLKSDKGITILLATHDIDLVPVYSDYVYIMKDGEVTAEGSPREIFQNKELIAQNNLRLPILTRLMLELSEEGLDVDKKAMSMQEVKQTIHRLAQRSRKGELCNKMK